MAQFDCFSDEALQFLNDLKANNTRDWFHDNKATYETHIKEPAKHFAADMANALGELTGHHQNSKIFRINRDVRFSKDKIPYNAHVHIAFTPDIPRTQPPMWFFGLSPESLAVGCGVFQYDKLALEHFRTVMAGSKGTELLALTEALRANGIRIGDPELKRVPPGYDKDHPNAEVLRRKGFSTWMDKDDTNFVTQSELISRTVKDMQQLMPVYSFLSDIG